MADVVDAIEGPMYPMYCLNVEDHTCFADARCGLQELWGDVYLAIRQTFERIKVILEQAEQIAGAVPLLGDRRQAESLERATQEIHRLENEADDLLSEALATLFDGVTEVPELIKAMRWNDLYQLLEDTTDKAETVATVLSNIALKNA